MNDVTHEYLEQLLNSPKDYPTFGLLKNYLNVFELEDINELHLNYDFLANTKTATKMVNVNPSIPRKFIGQYTDMKKNEEWKEYVMLKRMIHPLGFVNESQTYFQLDEVKIDYIKFIKRKYFEAANLRIYQDNYEPVECIFFYRSFDNEKNQKEANDIHSAALSDYFSKFDVIGKALPIRHGDFNRFIHEDEKKILLLGLSGSDDDNNYKTSPVPEPVLKNNF